MTRTGNHYERLGLQPEAAPEEIKRAYFRAVRQHPPERDPEGFRALREAYETLNDARSRREYDSLLKHGGAIERLFGEARQQMDQDDLPAAARSLRRILVLAPESEAARVQLAFCNLGQGKCEEAVAQFDRLCNQPDPSPLHLHWSAQARCRLAAQEDTPAARVAVLQREALQLFEQACASDPLNAEPYLGMARLHHQRSEHDRALACVEKAIAADGRVDFQDFEALHVACVIHLTRNDFAGFDRTLARIEALSGDPDQRRYVGWHFARSAWEASRAGAFAPAARLAAAALKFTPGETSIREMAQHFQDLAEVSREFERLSEEEDYLKLLLALELQISSAEPGEAPDLQKRWQEAVEFLKRVDPVHLQQWARTLKGRCPAFYRRNRDLVDKMLEVGEALAPVLSQARAAAEDPSLPPILRGVAGLAHDSTVDVEGSRRAQHDQAYAAALQSAAETSASALRQGVGHLKSRYPDLHRHQQRVLEEIVRVAGTRVPAGQGESGGCGCLVLLILGALASFFGGG